jgi:type IV pilus assembly protein PilO
MQLRDPKIQKMLLIYFVLAGAVYVYFMTQVVPITYQARGQVLEEAQAAATELETQIQKAKVAVKDMAKLEGEYSEMHHRWVLARELLPPDKEVAALLRKVTVAGARAGVEFVMFQPLGQVPQEHYTGNPVQVEVVGNYHQIATFLSNVANLSRIVNVADLKIHSYANAEEPEKSAKAEFVATAYSLKKEGGTSGATVQVGG